MFYMVPWGPDMFNGVNGSMNIHWNQGLSDIEARQYHWLTPSFAFGNISQYPDLTGGGWNNLLNPFLAINQAMSAVNGNGFPGFGATGGVGGANNGFNFNTNPWNPWGGNNGNSNSNQPANTPEEKRAKEKVETLLNALKDLEKLAKDENSSILSLDKREKLKETLESVKDGKKSYSEKLGILRNFFDTLTESEVKKFVLNDKYYVDSSKKISLISNLTDFGFPNENGKMKDMESNPVTALHETLDKIAKGSGETSNTEQAVSYFGTTGPIKPLYAISAWNSQYKNQTESIPNKFLAAYKKAKDSDKDTVKKGINNFVTSFVSQAKEIAGNDNLSESSQKAIKDAAAALEKSAEKMDGGFAKNFNELYVLTRIAAVKIEGNKLANKYGQFNSKFNEDMFLKETLDDLKEEKVANIEALKAKIKISANSKLSGSSSISDDIDCIEPKKALDQLLSEGYIKIEDEKATIKKGDKTEEYKMYSYKDSDGNTHKFILTDYNELRIVTKQCGGDYVMSECKLLPSEIVSTVQKAKEIVTPKEDKEREKEITALNAKVPNGSFEYDSMAGGENIYKESNTGRLFKVKGGTVKEVVDGKEKPVDTKILNKEIENSINESAPSEKSDSEWVDAGREMRKLLRGYTNQDEYVKINKYISAKDAKGKTNLNKDNIMSFLEGWYENDSHEGLIESLDDECDGGAIKMENKKNIINSLLAKAKEVGLENEMEYEVITNIMKEYNKDGKNKNKTTFNQAYKSKWKKFGGMVAGIATGAVAGAPFGGPIGAIVGGILGAVTLGPMWYTNNNEKIDTYMKALYEKIKAKQG